MRTETCLTQCQKVSARLSVCLVKYCGQLSQIHHQEEQEQAQCCVLVAKPTGKNLFYFEMGPFLCIRDVLRLFFPKEPCGNIPEKSGELQKVWGHAGQNMFEKDLAPGREAQMLYNNNTLQVVFFPRLIGSDRLYLHTCCTGYISGCRTCTLELSSASAFIFRGDKVI